MMMDTGITSEIEWNKTKPSQQTRRAFLVTHQLNPQPQSGLVVYFCHLHAGRRSNTMLYADTSDVLLLLKLRIAPVLCPLSVPPPFTSSIGSRSVSWLVCCSVCSV